MCLYFLFVSLCLCVRLIRESERERTRAREKARERELEEERELREKEVSKCIKVDHSLVNKVHRPPSLQKHLANSADSVKHLTNLEMLACASVAVGVISIVNMQDRTLICRLVSAVHSCVVRL